MQSSLIDWSQVDTVLLDMDGTLLDLHFDNFFWHEYVPEKLSEKHQIPLERAREDLLEKIGQLAGSLDWYCLDYWSDVLDLDIVGLKKEIKARVSIRPYVSDFLVSLAASGKRIMLVTNSHQAGLDIKMAETGLASGFCHIVVSHDYGEPKESLRFWQKLAADYSLPLKRTLLIDDNQQVLKTAETFGIAHLLTLKQPDSSRPPRDNLPYPAILHFDEILPCD